MELITAQQFSNRFAARYPNHNAGTLESVSAAAEQPGQIDSVEAMAIRDLTAPSGKQVYVKALIHFLHMGELVQQNQVVQIAEEDAKRLIRYERAQLATDADVAAAQNASK